MAEILILPTVRITADYRGIVARLIQLDAWTLRGFRELPNPCAAAKFGRCIVLGAVVPRAFAAHRGGFVIAVAPPVPAIALLDEDVDRPGIRSFDRPDRR